MKKVTALILTALLLLCGLCGCQSGNNTETTADTGSTEADTTGTGSTEASDEIKIGIAAPDVTHGWVAGVAYYAEKYCATNNLTYKITTSSDAAEMTANLNDLTVWGADVIVIWPQWTGMESSVQEIIDSGIKVVSFDFDIDCEGIYKVTGDNYGMGYQSAKYIVEKVGEAANIIVLDVPSAGSVAALRKEGFYAYLDEINYDKSNIKEISEANFSRDAGLKDMTDALESNEKIDAVFSLDDESSIGAIQAITEAGRTDIKAITGGGGMQEYFNMINNSDYDELGLASALYSPSMVEEAIKSAVAIFNGEEREAVIVIPTTIVTKANVADFIDPENTVY